MTIENDIPALEHQRRALLLRNGWPVGKVRNGLLAFRDRILSSPRFIRLVEGFPLTQPIARREARALFDICAGFVYSQTLFACIKLRIFEELSAGPLEEHALAERLGIKRESLASLMVASSALRLTEKRWSGRWGLGRLGAAVLASPGLAHMIEHHALFYRDMSDPVGLLNDTAKPLLSDYWAYGNGYDAAIDKPDVVGKYTTLMSATQPALAREILDAFYLKRCRCLLDVGGGDGTFLAMAGRRWPHLKLMLFELAAVGAKAKERFQNAKLADRAEVFSGDFTSQPLPGADAISLIRVVLDHDDASALRILQGAFAALPPGGRLLLAEPMAQTKGAETIGAYFSFYLMAMGRGKPRTKAELTMLLQNAGFSKISEVPTRQPLLARLLVAQRQGEL